MADARPAASATLANLVRFAWWSGVVLVGLTGCSATDLDGSAGMASVETSGCPDGWVGSPVDVRDHMIVADADGGYDSLALNGDAGANGFTQQVARILDALARHRSGLPPGAPLRLLIFVNGGLNDVETNLERAGEQVPCMLQAGYFPIFLVWQSGFLDAYSEQIGYVRNGHVTGSLRPSFPIYVLADVAQGVARAPATFLNQISIFVDGLDLYDADDFGATPDQGVIQSERLTVAHVAAPPGDGMYLEGVARFGLTWPAKIVTTPFTDSFGRTAWENMLRRTRTTLRQSSEFDWRERDWSEIDRYPRGTGVFAKFFHELEACYAKAADCPSAPGALALHGVPVTFIGHSMGTFIVGELVATFDRLPYGDIVYMAAASSIADFLRTVAPAMERRPAIRFYNLSLHPAADAREARVGGLAPAGSLLEWVDNMYAHPPTMLDRTLGKWLNVAAAEHVFPEAVRARSVFKVFGLREPADPFRHTDFTLTEMGYWLPEFWGAEAMSTS